MSDLFKLINSAWQYPEIKQDIPRTLYSLLEYHKLKNNELDNYYKTLLHPPTLDQKNTLRHAGASAVFAQTNPTNFVRALGQFKEDADRLDNKPAEDSFTDLINNERGIELGKKFPDVNHKSLFDYIMKYYAK